MLRQGYTVSLRSTGVDRGWVGTFHGDPLTRGSADKRRRVRRWRDRVDRSAAARPGPWFAAARGTTHEVLDVREDDRPQRRSQRRLRGRGAALRLRRTVR